MGQTLHSKLIANNISDDELKQVIIDYFHISPTPFYNLCGRALEAHGLNGSVNFRNTLYNRMLEIKSQMMHTTKEFFIDQFTQEWSCADHGRFSGNIAGCDTLLTPTLRKD